MQKFFCKLTACAVLLALVGTAAAQDAKSLDQQVNTSLRDVINRGAEMYNNDDAAGCYRLFEGALLAVKPLLAHRPDLQKSIERGLADAGRNPDMRRRAWALRRVLDDVRAQASGKAPAVAGKGGKPPLWDRLGGEANVSKVVDDFAALAAGDEKVNFTRDGKYKPTEEQLVALKKSLVALISATTGGPLKYTGKSMKEVHKGMGITNEEFDALGNDLVKALTKNGAGAAEIAELLKIVDSTRPDIVEAKKEPKDDEKKDEDKPKDKKPKDDDKKDEDRPKDKDDKPKDDKKDKDGEDK